MKRLYVVCALAALVVGAALTLKFQGARLYESYQRRKYPPIRERNEGLAATMDKDIRGQKYAELMFNYRRVAGLLTEAERKGHDVSRLRAKMPRILRLAKKGEFYFAKIYLNTVEMRIPRKREKVRVARPDENPEAAPDPDKRSRKRRGKRRRRRR